MQSLFTQFVDLLVRVLGQVGTTLVHNWPFLLVSILMAAATKLYLKSDAVAGFLRRHQKGGVLAATAAAVGTPLCSCGTTAVILGMMAGSMPWAPIVAFMVASPLTSPEELIYSAGLFGWPFAIAFFVASIILGLAGGMVGAVLDARGWLRNQNRFAAAPAACSCGGAPAPVAGPDQPARAPVALVLANSQPWEPSQVWDGGMAVSASSTCACAPAIPVATYLRSAFEDARPRFEWRPYAAEVAATARRLLPMFLGFAFAGYLINDLIPTVWITALFGTGRAYSIPLAATLGLPFYLNTEASLPLVRGMLTAGMSSGAALAFLITGAGTSIGAIAGALTIARWRVIALVIGTLWVGAVLCGFAYDALAAVGQF